MWIMGRFAIGTFRLIRRLCNLRKFTGQSDIDGRSYRDFSGRIANQPAVYPMVGRNRVYGRSWSSRNRAVNI